VSCYKGKDNMLCSVGSDETRGEGVDSFISDSFRKIEGTSGFMSVSYKIMRVCVCVCNSMLLLLLLAVMITVTDILTMITGFRKWHFCPSHFPR
jgi:hypothetical protein